MSSSKGFSSRDSVGGGYEMLSPAISPKMDRSKAGSRSKAQPFCDAKVAAFVSIGIITFFYVLVEVGAGIYLTSLVLLSDGFHNLSDVVSLYIAYWAQQAQKRELSDEMSYGWARTEILGGLTNGCFLLALCLYVVLESIPKFISPAQIDEGSMIFIIVAAVGLGVNTIGTIVFSLTGQSHGHSHSHGGHGHSHGSDKPEKKEKKKDKKKSQLEFTSLEDAEEGHGHSHGHEHGHAHDHEKKEKKEKKEKHGHSHGHKEKKEKKGHGHSHGHKEEKKKRRDLNVHAVFLHYLGDAISSLLVLIAGLILHFFKGNQWTAYIDPVASLVIVALIVFTTLPLVRRCSTILLQSTPTEVSVDTIRNHLRKVEGLVSIHDLHVWQLVDGMIISSIHISVEEGVDFTSLVQEVKRIFHEAGIHSSTIQPEFVPRNFQDTNVCEQNCVQECDEDWCCKRSADRKKELFEEYSLAVPI